jgi:hypothetical protein
MQLHNSPVMDCQQLFNVTGQRCHHLAADHEGLDKKHLGAAQVDGSVGKWNEYHEP